MPQYRVTGTRDFACSNPDGNAKPFLKEFEAADDDAAKLALPGFRTHGESWDQVSLVRIVVPEETKVVAL